MSALSEQEAQEYGLEPEPVTAAPVKVTTGRRTFRMGQALPKEHKPLPASLDGEKAVLSSILLNPGCLKALGLKLDHFHHPSHRTIFSAFCTLQETRTPIDLITVTQLLADENLLEFIGGPAVLADIQTFLPTSLNVDYYAEILVEKKALRDANRLGEELAQATHEEQGDALEMLRSFSQRFQLICPQGALRPAFSDLSPFLDGTAKQEIPTVVAACNGTHLFYKGRLNEIHAEPATGKTNVLLVSAIRVIESGGKVLYIDPEDTPQGFTVRLLLLGASADDIRDRVFYSHNPTPDEIKVLHSWAKEHKPALVVFDGLAEGLVAAGADENNAADVLTFFRDNLRPFAETGAAVVIADHVTKSSEGRGQFARGSGAKAGRYDGVAYEIVAAKPYTPTIEGFVKLKVAKDRNGGVGPRGHIAAELHFTPNHGGGTTPEFREPQDVPKDENGAFIPTAIMAKIVTFLEQHGESNTSALRTCGKAQYVDRALQVLLERGEIQSKNRGQSIIYSLTNKEEK